MKTRLSDAAQTRLARRPGDDEPMTEEEMVRVLTRIARTGRPGDRLRAIEMLTARAGGMQDGASMGSMTDDERAERIEAILARARARRDFAQAHGMAADPDAIDRAMAEAES